MGRLLFLLFLVVPMIEIGLFIVIGQTIGLVPTLLGVVLTAIIGSYIIRMQGVSLLLEIRRLTGQGQLPARQIADGVMLAVAGALLLTPGYFTDAMGFLLLVPPMRLVIYDFLKSRVSVMATVQTRSSGGAGPNGYGRNGNGPNRRDDGVIDLDDDNWRPS